MSSSEGNNTPSPSSVASSSQQPPALPSSSSSSQLQLATGKTTVKRESPQLKVENLARASTPKPLAPPTSISEWQLLAVLQRANLVQYYDMFISQGGDDINQIMQCDEGEFLEIMSLVGMLSKPLHVRRLQRALTEFSKDQTSFNLAAIQHIGPPPVSPYALSGPDMSFLMPGTALCDSPVLSDAQIRRLSSCAMAICQKIPRLPPKLVQNKKRVSKNLHALKERFYFPGRQPFFREVLDLLSASADTPNRLAEYRKYSAIYGRFDAKRKPDKVSVTIDM
ncbi:NAB region 1 [Ancylostoma duodenale]|uniref:NAB region 1 n=1 Tax=Ancylostoma duodenale TaxID=51022 RepID=A0A0C2D5Q3_9BILA|nr:NAB region 1 [Ancylostoma duodenale]